MANDYTNISARAPVIYLLVSHNVFGLGQDWCKFLGQLYYACTLDTTISQLKMFSNLNQNGVQHASLLWCDSQPTLPPARNALHYSSASISVTFTQLWTFSESWHKLDGLNGLIVCLYFYLKKLHFYVMLKVLKLKQQYIINWLIDCLTISGICLLYAFAYELTEISLTYKQFKDSNIIT